VHPETLTAETVQALRRTVTSLHRCKVAFKGKTHVTEKLKAGLVWDGDVYIFALKSHPTAKLAYAWSAPVRDSKPARSYVFLHYQDIHSALDAVRATILSHYE
jgi:hypothetical protein